MSLRSRSGTTRDFVRVRKIEFSPDHRRAAQRGKNTAGLRRLSRDNSLHRRPCLFRFRSLFGQAASTGADQFAVGFERHHLETLETTLRQTRAVVLDRSYLCSDHGVFLVALPDIKGLRA